MSGSGVGEPVATGETVARYVVHGSYVRRDKTVRPEAFVPHPHRELSVTRHLGLADKDVWRIGRDVAQIVGRTLHGRADAAVSAFHRERLTVVSGPVLPGNPDHANVAGWPGEKSAQKAIAQSIAAQARFLEPPAGE